MDFIVLIDISLQTTVFLYSMCFISLYVMYFQLFVVDTLQSQPSHTETLVTSAEETDSHSLEHLQPSSELTADLEHLCAEMTDEEISSALSAAAANIPGIDSSLNGNMAVESSLPDNADSSLMPVTSLSSTVPKECSPGNAGNLEDDLQLDKDFDLFAELNVNGK